ncbi:hypothetical protein [Mucilaginibacter glaciei]|uniref:Uncharacterized protein n=1 Tax=Mucilaginibacter glaciei TaxID=2772109 RepID=A0A926NU08_9SPHI|nr:hypothetical protein [Mucilaginibacter glaciei]MBD1394700.1 hypothetical protein [Mucilaginibacter glaciei]
MIRINLVARIAGDKNSFLDLVYIAFQLKQQGFEDYLVTFIGAIETIEIYQNIVRMAELLEVGDKIDFTKKSIPMHQLPDDIKSGYFFAFTVGMFMGYSAIESINLGFKTIFCNVDKRLDCEQSCYINVCPNLNAVIDLILMINKDTAVVDKQIAINNQLMKKNYLLNADEASLLKSLMAPNG